MRHTMIKNRSGFTIVEVTIAVAIIAILASISIVMYSRVQVETRNTDRKSKIDIIAGALEKYYNKNGEYPSCSDMTQSGTEVTTDVLPGMDKEALLVPNSPAGVTNSITCTSLSAGTGPDVFAYVGDGSSTCNTGAACLKYTLQYRQEGTGDIIAKPSVHTVEIGSVALTLTAQSASSTQVNLSWNNIASAFQYKYQRATNVDFTTGLVEATTSNISASVSGLTAGTTYYFRVLAVASGSESNWSNTASVASVIAQPTSTPVVTAVMVGTTAEGTASVVTCPAGTAQYQMRTRNTNTSAMGSWTAWNSWSTTRTLSVASTSVGWQYGFQSKARCLVGAVGSTSTADSNVGVTVRPIPTPAAPTYLTPSSFNSPNYAIVNYSGVCPSGTTRSDATFRTRSWAGNTWGPNPWGYNDQWLNEAGFTRNVDYWGKYKCKTYWTTSAYSPESHNLIPVTP